MSDLAVQMIHFGNQILFDLFITHSIRKNCKVISIFDSRYFALIIKVRLIYSYITDYCIKNNTNKYYIIMQRNIIDFLV
jgi:hypothetical protein